MHTLTNMDIQEVFMNQTRKGDPFLLTAGRFDEHILVIGEQDAP